MVTGWRRCLACSSSSSPSWDSGLARPAGPGGVADSPADASESGSSNNRQAVVKRYPIRVPRVELQTRRAHRAGPRVVHHITGTQRGRPNLRRVTASEST